MKNVETPYWVIILLAGHSAKPEQIVVEEDGTKFLKDEATGDAYRYDQVGVARRKAGIFGGRIMKRFSSVEVTKVSVIGSIPRASIRPNILKALEGREAFIQKDGLGVDSIYESSLFFNMLRNKAVLRGFDDEDIKQVRDLFEAVRMHEYTQLIAI